MESQESRSMKDRILKGMKGLQWKSVQGQIQRKSGGLLQARGYSLGTPRKQLPGHGSACLYRHPAAEIFMRWLLAFRPPCFVSQFVS